MRTLSRRVVGLMMVSVLLGLFVVGGSVSAATVDAGHNYMAVLSSGDEVPVAEQDALGWAYLHINDDGQSMTWTLWMNAINDPVAGHIHIGVFGNNGPVVVPLYSGKSVGAFSGMMSSGTITAKDFDGPLKGKTMDDLFAAMKSGNAYVNVHSAKYPGGQTRGQIRSDENLRLGS